MSQNAENTGKLKGGESQTVIYHTSDGVVELKVRLEDETLWLTQQQMAELFQTTKQNVSLHLTNIFKVGELEEAATVKDFLTVRQEGNRQVERLQKHYNLDAILSVGYRIDARRATEFRQWATDQLTTTVVVGDLQNAEIQENTDIVLYTGPDGKFRIELAYDGDTFWTTQKRMGEIFNVDVRTISYHLQQIFAAGELNRYSVIRKIWITADDGKGYDTMIYNLDAIIAVGYRVNSVKATHFRMWATQVLSEFIRKGFVIDDERFKQGGKWSAEHFDLVLERIRDIRASERMLYQKVTDIYATADDYLKDSPVTRKFYARVQNKLHWAITGQTAAEIIYHSADATKQNMGLT
ncbi:MAG: virulence RhuM family protein, partial [Tannerella sp.]|nr:virulence RhuM family protein [Tannerella sp.]